MDLHEKLHREYLEAKARLEALEHFVDLQEVVDPWKQTKLVSSQVNDLAHKFDVRNECDCCFNATVYAMPYIEFQGIKIYTMPCVVPIAKRYKNGILGLDRIDNTLGLNQTLIENIWVYLDIREEAEEEFDLIGEYDPH
jgi:hypothetical protein